MYDNTETFQETDIDSDSETETEKPNMTDTLSKEQFYNLATKAIKTYSGDPLKRTAFVNSLKLMDIMADATHKFLLVSL